MIETTIPEINVAELMEQVRAKVSEAAKENRHALTNERATKGLTMVSPEAIPPPPPLALPHPAPARKERVLALLDRARATIDVNNWIPKPLRRFFRKQGGYNRALLESVSVLAKANAELASRIEQLAACVEVQQAWLGGAHEKSAGNLIAANHRFDALVNGIERLREALQGQLDSNADQVAGNVSSLRKELLQKSQSLQRSHEELLKEFKHLQSDGEDRGKHIRDLQKEVERRAAADSALKKSQEELLKGFASFRDDCERSAEHLENLQNETDRNAAAYAALNNAVKELLRGFQILRTDGEHAGEHLRNLQDITNRGEILTEAARQRLDGLEERLTTEGAFLRAQLSNQDSLVQRLIASKGKLTDLDFIARAATQAIDGRFDAFYMSFEDRFRGSRNEIKERISFYLPYVWETKAGTAGHPVLDLGCGRGEWLELLCDSGMEARGVDINSAMLDLCRQRGLDVVKADALEYLRSLPDNSQGAVTGFHIIEHLPFEVLMDLLSEVQRVVEPGGFVIFESPNCKNLLVGACSFNIDPTHRNPVFPDTAKFMLEILGFHPVELEYLTPISETPFETDGGVHPVLKDLLYGPQDFAVIGFKAIEA